MQIITNSDFGGEFELYTALYLSFNTSKFSVMVFLSGSIQFHQASIWPMCAVFPAGCRSTNSFLTGLELGIDFRCQNEWMPLHYINLIKTAAWNFQRQMRTHDCISSICDIKSELIQNEILFICTWCVSPTGNVFNSTAAQSFYYFMQRCPSFHSILLAISLSLHLFNHHIVLLDYYFLLRVNYLFVICSIIIVSVNQVTKLLQNVTVI